MSEERDFERAWLAKFSRCLDEVAGEEIRREVMKGSEELSAQSNRRQVIDWAKAATTYCYIYLPQEPRQ